MSAQRKGVKDPFPPAKSYNGHFAHALEQPFPMAADCPLPDDVLEAIKFPVRSPEKKIADFWIAQLSALSSLAGRPLCSSEPWYTIRPAELSSDPKALNISLIAQLSVFTGIGALNWLSGYIYGFPSTGHISQSKTSPLTQKPDNPTPISVPELQDGGPERFKSRPRRPPNLADSLWKEALGQLSMG